MTSGTSPTRTMAPRSVQTSRGRDFSFGATTSDIYEIIKDARVSLGLYIHLPFCRTHCTYCAFAISTDVSLQDEYTDAVVREVTSSGLGPRVSVESIYFGGGTPSRMSLKNLERIVVALRDHFAIRGPRTEDRGPIGAEFSMESN